VSIGVLSNRKKTLLTLKEFRGTTIRVYGVVFLILLAVAFLPKVNPWSGIVFGFAPMVGSSVIAHRAVGRICQLGYNGKWALLIGAPYLSILGIAYLFFKSHSSDPIDVGPYDDITA